MVKKRGQVTLFIILGIVIFAIIAIAFYVQTRFRVGVTENEIAEVKNYVEGCLEDSLCFAQSYASNVYNSVMRQGITDPEGRIYETIVESYMKGETPSQDPSQIFISCVNNNNFATRGLNLKIGNLKDINVDVILDEDGAISNWNVEADLTIEINKGLNRHRLDKFNIEVNRCT